MPVMERPAHREPMVWLMLGIPAATVLGGIATLVIATSGGGLDAAPEPVQRTLQAQVADVGADQRAAAAGMQAALRVGDDGRVVVDAPAGAAADALTLRLVHPTRADADLEWTRAASATEWLGPRLPAAARGRWVLEDDAHGWRLVGEWPAPAGTAVLRPALR